MPIYRVDMIFFVKGTVDIEAVDPYTAQQIANSGNIGAMLGNVQSTDDAIKDWNFDIHLDKKVGKSRRQYKNKKK